MMENTPTTLAFLGNLGPWEIIIILVIALLIFGKRLPEVGKSLGKGIVEFKKGLHGVEDEIKKATAEPPESTPKEIDPPDESMDTAASKEATSEST